MEAWPLTVLYSSKESGRIDVLMSSGFQREAPTVGGFEPGQVGNQAAIRSYFQVSGVSFREPLFFNEKCKMKNKK